MTLTFLGKLYNREKAISKSCKNPKWFSIKIKLWRVAEGEFRFVIRAEVNQNWRWKWTNPKLISKSNPIDMVNLIKPSQYWWIPKKFFPCILYCYLYPLCILYRLYDFMQMKKLSDEFSARLNKLSDKLRSPL